MEKEELHLLRKLNSGDVSETQLVDLFFSHKENKRILLNLAMHPKFPERYSLDILPHLFPMDLVRLIRNKRTRPSVRKKAELEFGFRYTKFPLGEKLSFMKIAPYSLLLNFIEETNTDVLEVIFDNNNCTEDLVVKFINRKRQRYQIYQILGNTEWYKRSQVAEAIAQDIETPVKMMVTVIPFLRKPMLKKLYESDHVHQIVKNNIILYMKKRSKDVG